MKFSLQRKPGAPKPQSVSVKRPLQADSDSDSDDQEASFKRMMKKKSQKVSLEASRQQLETPTESYDTAVERKKTSEVSKGPQYMEQLLQSNRRRKEELEGYRAAAAEKHVEKARENNTMVFESEEYKKIKIRSSQQDDNDNDTPGSGSIRATMLGFGSPTPVSTGSRPSETSQSQESPTSDSKARAPQAQPHATSLTKVPLYLQEILKSRITESDLVRYKQRYWERRNASAAPSI